MSKGWREKRSSRGAERALVRAMLKGDETAFEDFADGYLPILHRFVRRKVGDPELTREIVQTTVCKVLSKLHTFRGKAALSTWLCACGRNEIAGYFRRQGRRPREVELEPEHSVPASQVALHSGRSEGPEGAMLSGERSRLVHLALDALPAHYGQALEWKYLEELSVREIASRLRVGPKAAESILTRARVAFKKQFTSLETSAPAAGVTSIRAKDGSESWAI